MAPAIPTDARFYLIPASLRFIGLFGMGFFGLGFVGTALLPIIEPHKSTWPIMAFCLPGYAAFIALGFYCY
jgi:hypothetical protein